MYFSNKETAGSHHPSVDGYPTKKSDQGPVQADFEERCIRQDERQKVMDIFQEDEFSDGLQDLQENDFQMQELQKRLELEYAGKFAAQKAQLEQELQKSYDNKFVQLKEESMQDLCCQKETF
jgi:hypothetical protein